MYFIIKSKRNILNCTSWKSISFLREYSKINPSTASSKTKIYSQTHSLNLSSVTPTFSTKINIETKKNKSSKLFWRASKKKILPLGRPSASCSGSKCRRPPNMISQTSSWTKKLKFSPNLFPSSRLKRNSQRRILKATWVWRFWFRYTTISWSYR